MRSGRRPLLTAGALALVTAAGAAGLLAVERAGAERPPPIDVIDLSGLRTPSPTAVPSAGPTLEQPAVAPTARPSPPAPDRSGDPARLVRPLPVPAGPRDAGPDDGDDVVGDDAGDGVGPGADDADDGADDGTGGSGDDDGGDD